MGGQAGDSGWRRLRGCGGYRKTAGFQTATLIYDATYWFCEKFCDSRSRMVDQMVQAARSGRQNIAEGSRASRTSSQSELRLVNVARASLEELLLDFEDYLRHRHLPQWALNDPNAQAVRQVPLRFRQSHSPPPNDPSDRSNPTDPTDLTDLTDRQRGALYADWLEHKDPAVRANAIICLIHQANYLLDQQIAVLEQHFVEAGGYSEQLATARLTKRGQQRPDQDTQIPPCPKCGQPLTLRTAKAGRHSGSQFWGCSAYPACKGRLSLDG